MHPGPATKVVLHPGYEENPESPRGRAAFPAVARWSRARAGASIGFVGYRSDFREVRVRWYTRVTITDPFRFMLVLLLTVLAGMGRPPEARALESTSPTGLVEIPFGLSNAYFTESERQALPVVLHDLGLSETGGRAGFVVGSAFRKQAETCKDEECLAPAYDFAEVERLVETIVGKGRARLWIVINPVSLHRFRDGQLRRDGKTYLPAGPRSRQSYRDYLAALVAFLNASGRKHSGNPDWFVVRWSVYNEVKADYNQSFGKKGAARAYADLALDSAEILRKSSPRSQIVLAGSSSKFTPVKGGGDVEFYRSVFRLLRSTPLASEPFDCFESHWFGTSDGYERNAKGFGVRDFYGFLGAEGHGRKDFVIRAGATYSGMDLKERKHLMDKPQSEADQAGFLVKRFVANLAAGAKRIAWSTLFEHRSYEGNAHVIFNFVGLMYNGVPARRGEDCDPTSQLPCPDPGNGVKKLSYYSYKLLVEKLRDFDPGDVHKLDAGSQGVSLFQFRKGEKIVYVAWSTREGAPGEVTLPLPEVRAARIRATVAVPTFGLDFQTPERKLSERDYPAFFEAKAIDVVAGKVKLMLGEPPVYLEPVDVGRGRPVSQ